MPTTILIALLAALLWGLWWLPIRSLEAAGLEGAWANLGMSLGALPALAFALILGPFLRSMVFRRNGLRQAPFVTSRLGKLRVSNALPAKALVGALLVGLAIFLYGTALTFTDVVRAVLLFYLSPVWSLLIECVFLGRRWGLQPSFAVLFSFGGIFLVLGGAVSFTGLNIGDAMAFVSGICWSVAAALIFTTAHQNSRQLAFVSVAAGCAVTLVILSLAGEVAGTVRPDLDLREALMLSLFSGTVYMAPLLLATLWAAYQLPPATVSFILTAEILSGVGSSALMLREPFGLPQALGCALVIAGAASEVLRSRGPSSNR